MAAAYTKDHPGRARGGLHDRSVESPTLTRRREGTSTPSPATVPRASTATASWPPEHELSGPDEMAVGAAGNLLIAGAGNGLIRMVTG
jgi:hypothetical protein